jgi:hypothetical protein
MILLSRADISLLTKLPAFRDADISPGIAYHYLHPLLDLGLLLWDFDPSGDYLVATRITEEEGLIALDFDCPRQFGGKLTLLLAQFQNECESLGLPGLVAPCGAVSAAEEGRLF